MIAFHRFPRRQGSKSGHHPRFFVASFWLPVICLLQLFPDTLAFATSARQRPNVIVIFTDDHGYADLGCQQVLPDVRTPHIDELAARGVRMTNGYITAPQCVPSRGGLMTGQASGSPHASLF